MRYFHQSPDYWLDHCTLQDWREIYQRELNEVPPADSFIAAYFEHEAPGDSIANADDDGEVEFDLTDCEQ